jgi:hypothetical protein
LLSTPLTLPTGAPPTFQVLLDVVVFLPRAAIPIEARGHKQRKLLRYMMSQNLVETLHVALTHGEVDYERHLRNVGQDAD